MNTFARIATGAAILTAAALPGVPALAQDPPQREITQIAGDLYMFRNNFHNSVFLVTPAGVIATDPINADAAAWLENEIRTRFNQEIRYLVYSHDHFDHINGGEVFDDTAVVVAHVQAKADIKFENRATAVPELTFSDRMTIELGGKTVELIHVGRNHSDNSIVMLFPDERTLFAVDFIPVRTLAFIDFPDAYIPEWIDSLHAVEAIDFDVLVPGHGGPGTKADVAAFRGYMQDLQAAVQEAIRAGQTVEEAQASIKLEAYQDWGQYQQWLPLNVAGMYTRLQAQRQANPTPR